MSVIKSCRLMLTSRIICTLLKWNFLLADDDNSQDLYRELSNTKLNISQFINQIFSQGQ